MKRLFLILMIILMPNASKAMDIEKQAFLQGAHVAAPQLGMFIYMMDEILKARCGGSELIASLIQRDSTVLDFYMPIFRAIEAGQVKEAQSLMDNMQCIDAKLVQLKGQK